MEFPLPVSQTQDLFGVTDSNLWRVNAVDLAINSYKGAGIVARHVSAGLAHHEFGKPRQGRKTILSDGTQSNNVPTIIWRRPRFATIPLCHETGWQ